MNLLAYPLIEGEFTAAAEQAYRRDRRWVAPRAHRFELLNILATNVRAGVVSVAQAEVAWLRVFRLVSTSCDAAPMDVLRLSVQAQTATYDCEYVALAGERRLRVVTNDGGMLRRFPDVAVSIVDFAAGQ